MINLEIQHGLDKVETYRQFASKVLDLRKDLNTLLQELKKKKKRIIGLGAPAKGNVLTNFFGIGCDTLDYLADSTPYKHGLYTPLNHIPIVSELNVTEDQPDYALILAWNFKAEIMRKYARFKKRGGKFIIPIPEVRVV